MLLIFATLLDNYKVVGYEVIFRVAKFQKISLSEFKTSKKRSNSAAIFTRVAYHDVRTLGLGIGSLYSMFLF